VFRFTLRNHKISANYTSAESRFVSDNNESEISKPELPCCEGDLCRDDWHRTPIHLGAFFLVVLLIQAVDVLLRLRVEDIRNKADLTEKLVRAIGDVSDVLFFVVFVVVIIEFLRRRFNASRESHSQFTLIVLCVYLSAASLNVLVNMVTLVMARSLQNASQNWLILDLGLLFVSNMLAFSLWYQLADAYVKGGAFDFPPNGAHPDDPPRWVDYLFLSFNTQSTFGPTIEGIRTRPVKVMMMLQTSLSLILLIVLVARIIVAPS
jgi:hypothetical protein